MLKTSFFYAAFEDGFCFIWILAAPWMGLIIRRGATYVND